MDIITVILWGWMIVVEGCVLAMGSPFFFTPKGTWMFGKSYCDTHDGRMLTIDSQTKYDYVIKTDSKSLSNFIFDNAIFIGLSTETNNCTEYFWTSGKPLAWAFWAPSGNYQCVTKRCIFLKKGQFNTGLCSGEKITVCEFGEFLSNSTFFASSIDMPLPVAYSVCSKVGGRLVVIDREEKATRILLALQNHFGSLSDRDPYYWIGLLTLIGNCKNLTWIDGTTMGWTNFESTKIDCTIKTCVSWNVQTNKWSMSSCEHNHYALCEYDNDKQENFFIAKGNVNWYGAGHLCKENEGVLATPDTLKRSINALHILLIDSERPEVWVGIWTDSKDCTDYKWTNGNPLSWADWSPGEPDACSTQKCVTLTIYGLKTTTCSQFLSRILCSDETSTPTESAILVTKEARTEPKLTTTVETRTTTVEKTTTTTSNTVNASCGCCTRRTTNTTSPSRAELLEAITQLRAELFVNKNNTSTYQRKRISVYESRPSSMAMGGVACTIMSVVIGWLVVPDFITMCMFLFKCFSR